MLLRSATAVLLALLAASPAMSATWRQLAPDHLNGPLARTGHAMVLDAPGRRLVVWGERIPAGEIWTMPLDEPSQWTRVETRGTSPPTRVLGSAIFDPVRRRMILFGGGQYETNIDYRNDVWALSLDGVPTWTELAPTGTLPDPRHMHAAIYDAPRDRMVVFGGISSVNPPYVTYENSVWALSLGDAPTWTKLAPTGTPPDWRLSASLVYDAVGDRALMFGGSNYLDYSNAYRSDTWALSLSGTPAWSKLTTSGGPPSARYEHVAVMDERRNRMLIFGGRGLNIVANNETWALSLGGGTPTWTRLGASTVTPRYMSAAVLDPQSDRLIVDGGSHGDYRLSESLAMPLAGPHEWQALAPPAPLVAPPARIMVSPLVDPVSDRLLVQGGYDYTSTVGYPKDLWSWALGDPASAWVNDLPAGSGGLTTSSVILDPPRGRQMRFFSGPTGVEVMALDALGAWVPLPVAGTSPPARYGYSLAYDSARDRILLSSGHVDATRGHHRTYFTDIWALSLAGPPTWQRVRADGGGPHLYEDALVYDAAGDQLVGLGWDNVGRGTWAYPSDGSSDWSLIGGHPAPFWNPGIAMDPLERQIVAVDLKTMTAWRLSLAGTPSWNSLPVTGTPPRGRVNTRVAFDGVRRRILIFGGMVGAGYTSIPLGDLWALELADPVPQTVSVPQPVPLALAARPNPSSGSPHLVFTLPGSDPAKLELFDLAGRRVESLDVGALGAGEHSVPAGRALTPGVYVARLTQQGRTLTARIAVTR